MRRRTSAARWSKGALAAALLALALPASAMAHTPAATVSCTGATFKFTQFAAGSNTVNWRVTVDGATFRQGAFKLPGNGRYGTLPVPYTLNDTHTVEAFAWWGPGGIQDGDTRPANAPAIAHEVVRCAPSTPPPTTTPPPATTPPASTTPPAPAGAAAPVQVPASNVAGTQARSAAARLAVPRRCATRTVRVRVTGRQIRRVTLRVNGRSVRTVNVRSGQRTVTVSVPLRRSGASRQRVQARVTFRNGTRSRTLNASARRCAQTAVRPQFTG